MFRSLLLATIVGFFSLSVTANTTEYLNSMIQPNEIQEDITLWMDWLEKTHPDLSYTVNDVELFYKNVESIKNQSNKPISITGYCN